MKQFFTYVLLTLNLTLQAGIPLTSNYFGPTESLIIRETWGKIESSLVSQNVPTEMIPLFDKIAKKEDWGHIGYHGSTQEFRFFQDVIRFTIEEILAIQIKKNFHFLRIPGDSDLNLNTIKEFVKYWGEENVNNRDSIRAKQLLSLNFGIYSNFKSKGSCSVKLFAKDKSSKPISYIDQLIPFYEKMGIKNSEASLKKLHKIFSTCLKSDSGILLQFSENSHLSSSTKEAYNFADKLCYPAKSGGYRYDEKLISAHFKRAMSDDYMNNAADISDQIRLLVNNRHTLNPFSHFTIQRWDLVDAKAVTDYEKEMRLSIRKLTYDSKKVVNYHDSLMKEWKKEVD
ncbi:MAG: hypothetical protein H0W50_05130 [Parachlamydiaceae bacterium]|nr:hypothetical protein [Parachlamydiaceae bacterium]